MFLDIFLFELRYRFTRSATYIYFGLLFLVGFILFASGSTPASEKVFHNAPIIVAELQLIISIFGIFIASAVMGVPLYRDLEHKTGTFLFSYPIKESAFFMGRFWGSFLTLLFISFGVTLGIFLGSVMGPALGWTEASRFGPNPIMNYLQPWFTLVLPNLWMAGTLFFALIIFTKNIKSIYSGGVLVFIVYLLANFLAQDLENKKLVQLLDPFALQSFSYQVRYLTPFERNTFLLDVGGNLLANRLLWSGVGLVFFIAAFFKFSFSDFFSTASAKIKEVADKTLPTVRPLGAVKTDFSSAFQWSSLKSLARIELSNITRDVYFRSILLGGLVFLILDFWISERLYGVPSYPSTSILLEYKGFTYTTFVFIILVFFTGETLHRDKSTGYSAINDTFPVKDGVIIASKFMGMALAALVLATLPMVVGVLVQTLKGYFHYDFKAYLIDSYLITYVDYLQMIMLVFAVHLLVNNKFGGHAVSIALWLLLFILRSFVELNFNLFFFSYKPNFIWSDMNGLGHFAQPLLWFNVYWTAFGLFLVLFFSLFYSRGTEAGFLQRFKGARQRMMGQTALFSYAFFIVFLLSGAYIFQQVVYVNGYLTNKESEKRMADYEKQMKHYEGLPQPKVIDINLKGDIYPEARNAYFSARVRMVNKTEVPIDSLHVVDMGLSWFHLLVEGDTLAYRFPLKFDPPKFQIFGEGKPSHWYKIYALPHTLQPGDTLEVVVATAIENKGFSNGGYSREVVYNGTFVSGMLPQLGYNARLELTSDEKRRKYDLPEKDRELPAHDDPEGINSLLFVRDADFIHLEATISTSPDQIAIVPGYLQKEWTEGDRRYFHYIQDTPIQSFFSVVSARYQVLRDEVTLSNGKKVDLEIFHHPHHDKNLDRFMAAYKDALTYFSDVYSPFQFRQMRLLEFPRYAGFAQSFPNTVPFSESFGWLAHFRDPNDFDYTYYVTAHEVAHQWWGHQVAPNYTQGSNLISEALAEFSALVLSERRYGKDNMKRFLKEELDSYLRGRSGENKKENTFINCDRPYQWYYKGSLILYGLRDYIGEARMDSALRAFADEYAMKTTPPFAGSHDLYRHLKAQTPDSLHYYLVDTWEKITLYENKALSASMKKVGEGEYDVTLTVKSQKLYADSLGMETPAVYMGDYMDIGVFAADDKDENGRTRTQPLYLKKHKLAPGEHTFTLRVKGMPQKAGIDPYHKLIDRIPDDNLMTVEEK
jgi:ABC-2 type transport system permease protein